MRKYLILVCILILTSQLKSQPNEGNHRFNDSKDSCLSQLEYYSHYWIKDSLGKNGFRDFFGKFILKDCNCAGQKWSIVRKFLGKPNQTAKIGNHLIYRFRLNHFSKSITDIGTELLEVRVDNQGVITSFNIYEVDG